jgi:hypothetical protein
MRCAPVGESFSAIPSRTANPRGLAEEMAARSCYLFSAPCAPEPTDVRGSGGRPSVTIDLAASGSWATARREHGIVQLAQACAGVRKVLSARKVCSTACACRAFAASASRSSSICRSLWMSSLLSAIHGASAQAANSYGPVTVVHGARICMYARKKRGKRGSARWDEGKRGPRPGCTHARTKSGSAVRRRGCWPGRRARP